MADDFSTFPEVGDTARQGGDFDQFPEVSGAAKTATGTAGAQGSAALEAGGRSALETSGFVGGAMLGAKAGLAAAPFLGPAAPVAPFVGGLVGGIGGYKSGELASESAGLRSPEQMPAEVRPGGYFGQSVGGAVPVGGGPLIAARTGFRFGESMVGNFLNQIIETAKTMPLRFGVAETASAVSAGIGAGAAEVVAPGQSGVRGAAELTAGLLNPTRLTMNAVSFGNTKLQSVMASMSPAARETMAAKVLQDLLATNNEDPAVLARLLKQKDVAGLDMLTAAQKTGSPSLGGLEELLAKESAKFGAESEQRARDGMDSLRAQVALLAGTGDQAALAAAAQIRAAYFRTLVKNRIDAATNEVVLSARKVSPDTPEARDALSVRARDVMEKALADTKAVETELWGKVDGTRPVEVSNLRQTFDEIVADTLPELRGKKMPAVVRDFLNRVSKPTEGAFDYDPTTLSVRPITPGVKGTNAGEMRKLRTELLSMARAASRDPDQAGMERVYNNLAEAVLDDMDAAFKQAGDKAYDEARTFTRELNDTFTRSFAGKAMAEGKYGDRVAPELLLRKAFATGKEAGALQLRELEEASRFLAQRGLGDDTTGRQMLDLQERFIRISAAEALDPATGRANPERIGKFIRENQALLRRFPEVEIDLRNAIKSDAGLKRLENRAKNVETLLSKQTTFGQLMGGAGTNADTVARRSADRALVSADQETELVKLVNIAKGGGAGRGGRLPAQQKEAMDGLNAAIMNAVLDRSMRGNALDMTAARNFLFTPSSVGKKPPIQVMQEQGIIDAKHAANIKKLFDAADNIARAQRPGTAIDVDTGIGDFAIAALSRAIGATAAGGLARMMGSTTPSLVVHGAGARLAEQAIAKVPNVKVKSVLTEAMTNPELMTLLLTKASTVEKSAMQARQIHAWLVQSGLTSGEQAYEQTFNQPAQPAPMFTAPR